MKGIKNPKLNCKLQEIWSFNQKIAIKVPQLLMLEFPISAITP